MNRLRPFEVPLSGMHLIEASAGTGKTYNIASLYVRALIETDKTADEILVVTFTEAATKELRDRLLKRLRESIRVLTGSPSGGDSFLSVLPDKVTDTALAVQKLRRAVHSFDEAAVYTIHGFCLHALQEWAFESGASFETELIGDDSEIIGEVVDDHWRKTVQEYSEDPRKRILLKLLIDQGYGPEKLANELAPYLGKPYLQPRPNIDPLDTYKKRLRELVNLYASMQETWNEDRSKIRSLLLSDPMSGNRFQESYLQNWMPLMDEWMNGEVAPVLTFDKFSRFAQSYVSDSLKKSSIEKGISPPEHRFFKQVDDYIKLAERLQNFPVHFLRKLFSDLIAAVADKKEELQVFSYDDLLVRLRNALNDDDGQQLRRNIRGAYPIALVDEFQDTDPVQYQIFNDIYGTEDGCALFMIGDPKQSIYGFRGADIFAYLKAKIDAPADNMHDLRQNYRSVPSLIEGVNTLFGSHTNPFILKKIPFHPVQPAKESPKRLMINEMEATPLEIRRLSVPSEDLPLTKGTANNCTAEDTAAQIHAFLGDAKNGKIKIGNENMQAQDIAVLVRSHRQATYISDALRERDIKSVTQSRESVFQSEEATELYTVLKAVVEPSVESHIITALSTSIMGCNANELFALKEDEEARAEKMQQFAVLHEKWQQHGFAYMFRLLMQHQNVAETVMNLKNGERMLTNLLHLSELISQQQRQGRSGIHSLMKWLLKKRNEDEKDIEDEQLRLESDENLVNIMTIHQSKGLEFPVVFCPFLWYVRRNRDEGKPIVYHDGNDKSKTYLDFRGKDDPDRAPKRFLKAREDLAEEVRLAYVAITRAQYKCVINWVHVKKSTHSALGYLLAGEDTAFESLRASVFSDKRFDESNASLFQPALRQLADHPSIAAPVVNVEQIGSGVFSGDRKLKTLHAETFNRALPLSSGYRISSFSSLTRGRHSQDEQDYPVYFDDFWIAGKSPEKTKTEENVFSFPRGPNPGTAIHHIFENITFDNLEEMDLIIAEKLAAQLIDENWVPVARKMVESTIKKELLQDQQGMQLQNIPIEDRVSELEFYFSSGEARLQKLLQIIRPEAPVPVAAEGFADEGFLKGFIDLTFCYENRYYILDYKTNHLGDTINDYRPENLNREMREAYYDLQYHIYCVALHRFLGSRMKDYTYNSHFGGAFYLFVRGINQAGREGIYFDRPDASTIRALDNYFKRKVE